MGAFAGPGFGPGINRPLAASSVGGPGVEFLDRLFTDKLDFSIEVISRAERHTQFDEDYKQRIHSTAVVTTHQRTRLQARGTRQHRHGFTIEQTIDEAETIRSEVESVETGEAEETGEATDVLEALEPVEAVDRAESRQKPRK